MKLFNRFAFMSAQKLDKWWEIAQIRGGDDDIFMGLCGIGHWFVIGCEQVLVG